MMTLNKSYLLAGGCSAALALWLLSGYFGRSADVPAAPAATPAAEPMSVQVRMQQAVPVVREIILQGQAEPNRTVTLRAETPGKVSELVAERGQRIKAGDVILGLALDVRAARLKQAQALLRQRENDYQAIRRLGLTGYQAQTRVDEAAAQLEAARAELELIQRDIDKTTLRAPFDGVLDERPVEIGDYVAINDELATLVDDRPLVVAGRVPQRNIRQIAVGSGGTVRFVTGQEARGTVRYLSTTPDAATRTFRVELEIPNPDGAYPIGISTEIRIPVETVATHFISPALLTLNTEGVLGVNTVTADDIVEFHPVDIVRAGADGIWVSGLPEQVRLITVGQGFVQTGELVRVVPEPQAAELEPSRARAITLRRPGPDPLASE